MSADDASMSGSSRFRLPSDVVESAGGRSGGMPFGVVAAMMGSGPGFKWRRRVVHDSQSS